MIKKAIKYLIAVVGATFGIIFYILVKDFLKDVRPANMSLRLFDIGLAVIITVLFAIIFYFLAPFIIDKGQKIANYFQGQILKMPLPELITSIVGLVIGIVIAYLLSNPISKIPFAGIPISILLYVFLGYIGMNVGRLRKDEISKYLQKRPFSKEKSGRKSTGISNKILDTSIIIDGRIAEIISTGFLGSFSTSRSVPPARKGSGASVSAWKRATRRAGFMNAPGLHGRSRGSTPGRWC